MAWELLAMWAIVIATLVWFVRDERRVRAEAELERSARYYAHAPKYRHIRVEQPPAPPQRRPGGLSAQQRAFMAALATAKAPAARPDSISAGQ
ncbi:hypothetical protein [Devosia sp. A449]